MEVQFTIAIPDGIHWHDFNPINKPITNINGNCIGVITEAYVEDNTKYYKCKGIIWDKFVGYEINSDNKYFTFLVIK